MLGLGACGGPPDAATSSADHKSESTTAHSPVSGLVQILDRDRDGHLSVTEASAISRRPMAAGTADTNADERISSDELIQFLMSQSPEIAGNERRLRNFSKRSKQRLKRRQDWISTLRSQLNDKGHWNSPCPTAVSGALDVPVLPPATDAPTQIPSQPNIVLVSIDGLRADRTSLFDHSLPTTPNLQHFAAQGIHFPNAFSQSNESLFSHASIFTGRYVSEIAWPDYTEFLVSPEAMVIPEVLTAGGYATGAFIGGGHIGAEFGFDQGFQTFFSTEEMFGSFFETVPNALRWIDSLQGSTAPFFVFLHGYDLHRPYVQNHLFYHPFSPGDSTGCLDWDRFLEKRNFVEHIYARRLFSNFEHERHYHKNGAFMLDPSRYELLSRHGDVGQESADFVDLAPEMVEHARTHYDASVLAGDTYVGLFIEKLKNRGLWNNTIVILTSDHGEDLLDHGFFNHRAVLQDSTTKVPMVITGGALPQSMRGVVDARLVDAVDILPTIVGLAGMSVPVGVRGHNMLKPLEGSDKKLVFQSGVVGQSSVRVDGFRLVFGGLKLTDPDYGTELTTAAIDGGRFKLYDLASDPKEQTDVLAANPARAEALRLAMVHWWSTMSVGQVRKPLTDSQRDMLRKHGYW